MNIKVPVIVFTLLYCTCVTLFANTYPVTNTSDSGAGSLRAAVDNSNANAGSDTITFDPGINGDIILLTTANDIDITDTLYIKGNGPIHTIIDGNNNARIFDIPAGVLCTISGLNLQNGNASGAFFPDNAGGAILNVGTLTIRNCTISGSTAVFGGGVSNDNGATAYFYNTTIAGNNADVSGGVDNFNSTMVTFYNSSIIDNESTGNGGGISNLTNATTLFYNTAISGNKANNNGGGISNIGGVTTSFYNSTISGNQATNSGGGIDNFSNSSANFFNSIIAKNTGTSGPDVFFDSGTISASHSLIGDDSDSSFPTGNNNIIGTSANPVDPLFAEDVPGAPTPAGNLRLLPCSPAINAGINDSLNLATDTLDLAGNPRVVYDTVDMGAYEMQGLLFDGGLHVTTTYNDGCGSLRFAVNNAEAGDTVRFDSSIDGDTIKLTGDQIIIDTSITIWGNGAIHTIIDACDTGRIFQVNASDSVSLVGITLQNGNVTQAPFMDDWGGALSNNGILKVYNCTIRDNRAFDGGGFANLNNSTIYFYNSSFSGNVATESGGGGLNFNSTAIFYNTSFSRNQADGGGALLNDNATANFYNATLSANQANILGGAFINSLNATANFYNTAITGNQAANDGGGIYNFFSTANFNNTSISGNQAANDGGGIYNFFSTANFNNSIIAKNTAVSGPDIFFDLGTISASHSLIGDSTESNIPAGINNIIGTNANPVDPLFAEDVPAAPSTDGNLQLQPCSPAINAGTNDSLDLATDTIDIAGNPRVVYDTVDMGAYEMQGVLFSDDLLVTTTYDDGCGSLRFAIKNAQDGDTVRFDSSIDGDTIKLTGDQILVDTSITIRGNGAVHNIIDACDTGRIFQVPPNDTVSVIGVTLQNGNASGSFPDNAGGAIYNGGMISVHDCIITGNQANFGGGIENFDHATADFYNTTISNNQASFGGGIDNEGNSTVNFYNCDISGNQANDNGGGVDNFNNATANFYNSVITENQSTNFGGGILNLNNSTANFDQVIILSNQADWGGGVYSEGNSSLNFRNTSISGNQANTSGGGIINQVNTTASFTNSSISGNHATFGGGILNQVNATANFTNSSIAGNMATTSGGGIGYYSNSIVNFTNCIIAKNTSPFGPDLLFFESVISASHTLIGDSTDSNFPVGNNNIIGTSANPVDPLFVVDVDTMNLPNSTGDLRIQSCSPARNVGTNAALTASDTIDLFGNPRVAYDTVDMGAAEFPDPAPTDTIFYSDCICQDTLIIDNTNISGLYRAAQVIRIEGNVTLSGDTELWAKEVFIDPVFEGPVGIRFETLSTGCGTH